MNINQPNNISVTPVQTGEGCPALSVKVYFNAAPNIKQSFDLTYLADTQGFKGVQCVYIDNADNDGELKIHVDETDQIIKCPARRQGYFPILVPSRSRFYISHLGTAEKTIPIFFLNFTVAQGVW